MPDVSCRTEHTNCLADLLMGVSFNCLLNDTSDIENYKKIVILLCDGVCGQGGIYTHGHAPDVDNAMVSPSP